VNRGWLISGGAGEACGLSSGAPAGAVTVMVAVAVLAVPPSVEVNAPDVLFLTPAVVPVTFTANVHDPLAASVAPDKLMVPVPCVAVIVPPPHEPLSPFGVATTNPDGRLSLNPTPDNEGEFGLVIVKLSDVVPFNGIDAAPNALEIDGGDGSWVNADAVNCWDTGTAPAGTDALSAAPPPKPTPAKTASTPRATRIRPSSGPAAYRCGPAHLGRNDYF
jgi:hypothetical protein